MTHIKNTSGEDAIIINLKEIPTMLVQEKQIDYLPCRIYFWIDDQPITITEIDKFKCLFNVYRLKDPKFFGGRLFHIDKLSCDVNNYYFYDEYANIPQSPRRAGDGGVIR